MGKPGVVGPFGAAGAGDLVVRIDPVLDCRKEIVGLALIQAEISSCEEPGKEIFDCIVEFAVLDEAIDGKLSPFVLNRELEGTVLLVADVPRAGGCCGECHEYF